MTNFEKYKTANKRAEAFCRENEIVELPVRLRVCDIFHWLDLEAEDEKPLPCPFCGEPTKLVDYEELGVGVECTDCDYASSTYDSIKEAIAGHNRVAKAVMDAKVKEKK